MAMKRIVCTLLALVAGPAVAGVVYEIEVTDHEQSPPKTESMDVSVEGRQLKMDIAPGSGKNRGSGGTMMSSSEDAAAGAIAGGQVARPAGGQQSEGFMAFNGNRREMLVVDHHDKSYHVFDVAAIKKQVGNVAEQVIPGIEEALKNVPADQRAMLEEMFKGNMPGGMTKPAATSVTEIRKTGERANKNGYPCVKYEVLRNGQKIRELWVTDWGNIEGGSDVAGTFEDMADFFAELADAIPNMGGEADLGDNIYTNIGDVDGFPVVVREFDGGSLESESSLRSARRQTLDPDAFEPPAGYKRMSMLGGG